MAVDVRAVIDIERPRGAVASFAMEAENDPKWIGGISSARRLTEPPTAVGTRVERLASFLGRRIEYVMEVTEYSRNERIVMRSIKSPFPMRVTYSFEDVNSGTRASIRVEGDGGGFLRDGRIASWPRGKAVYHARPGDSSSTARRRRLIRL